MRIALLGAAGAMAQVTLRDLLDFVPEVRISAFDARPFQHPDPRVTGVVCDVRDEAATAALLAGHDAALNCVTYYFNLPVMRACLAARVPYTDLGGLYHGSLAQFALDGDFRAAGVPALLGMGSTPGITNAMAGALAPELDTVEEVHVRVAAVDESAGGVLPVPYALDTVLDEFALEPMVLEGGVARAVPPASGAEAIDFPPPVGRAEAIYTLHSEVAMFPRSFPGLAAASFKVAFAGPFVAKMRFLAELGFASREPVVGGVSPRSMLLGLVARQPQAAGEPADCDVLRTTVVGRRGGRRVELCGEAVIRPHPAWGFAAGALDTGVPLSLAGQYLARREIATPGVHCPEVALPFARFFTDLAQRGIPVRLDRVGKELA